MYLYLLFHLILSRILLKVNRTGSQMLILQKGKLKFRLPTRLYSQNLVQTHDSHLMHYNFYITLYYAIKFVFSAMGHRMIK